MESIPRQTSEDLSPPVSPRSVELPEQLLTVREVAQRLRVCTATVYKLCAAGELVHVRISNAIRVSPRELAEFLARRRSKRQKKNLDRT